jgi:hypothetical protein
MAGNDEHEEGMKKSGDASATPPDDTDDSASAADFISQDMESLLLPDTPTHATDLFAAKKRIADAREQIRLDIPDIVARAKALAMHYPPDFREVKSVGGAGSQMTAPLNTDLNIMVAFDCLFGEGTGRPYFDTFKGLNMSWTGEPIDQDFNLRPLIEAMHVFRIPNPSFEKVERLFHRFARQKKINSLIERMNVMVPEWDRLSRMETALIRLFESFDTDLNRQFGQYFWLSLYNRAMQPGCNAPIVLALFGSGGIGKSYFGTLISREMIGSESADSVPLEWTRDFNDFLRDITGKSVIANVAEMAGFTRADMTKIKSLTTRTMDVMNEKFEKSIKQLRQWVMIMDGNEYAGLQRDETGNRRFYPMFVGQLPFDTRGQVQWRNDFYVNFDSFRDDFWQLMAESKAWMEEHGMHGYQRLVADTEKKVKAFSEEEMRMDRGTIRDDDMDMYMAPALAIVEPMFAKKLRAHVTDEGEGKSGRVTNKQGAIVPVGDMRNALAVASGRNMRIIPSHMKNKLTSIGARSDVYANQRVFVFDELTDRMEWDRSMREKFGDLYSHFRKKKMMDDNDNF